MAWNALVGRAGSDQREVLSVWQAEHNSPATPVPPSPRGRRHVLVMVVPLQRMLAGRMAVHAARMGDDLGDLVEQRARALGLVADAGERGERAQVARVERARCSAPARAPARVAAQATPSTPNTRLRMIVRSSLGQTRRERIKVRSISGFACAGAGLISAYPRRPAARAVKLARALLSPHWVRARFWAGAAMRRGTQASALESTRHTLRPIFPAMLLP